MIKLPDMEKFTHGLWPYAVAAIEAYSAEVQRLNATAQPVSDGCRVPEGWKLVPIEPTKEMRQQIHPIAEGTCHHCYATVNPDCEENVLLSWRDMLAAAPGGQ